MSALAVAAGLVLAIHVFFLLLHAAARLLPQDPADLTSLATTNEKPRWPKAAPACRIFVRGPPILLSYILPVAKLGRRQEVVDTVVQASAGGFAESAPRVELTV